MILIIAEKPSLARNIAAGIGDMKNNTGYLEGQGYLVTWAFGHLFSLCDIEEYTGATSTGHWSMENIPCFPAEFRFKLRPGKDKRDDPGVARQFGVIKRLCARPDVDCIVNAGDADREGEIIVRLCIMNALEEAKPVKRLWLPDQTPETVAAALGEMKDDSEYDNLANEGFARTYVDWLYGVNLTRYASLRAGTLLRVGRVIVPIVKAVYDRDMAIKNFVPDIYYALVSSEETNGETVELVSKYKFPKEQAAKAQRACDKLNAQTATVTAKKTKKDTLKPGKLYSLSKLQNYLGKKYKMSMDDSLRVTQALYEKGFLTYPRTNSEYLATAEKDKIQKIVGLVANLGYPVAFSDKKTIFDDSKIESHSALTPTYKIPKPDALSPEEKTVYTAVLRRFVAVFCKEECVAQKTELTVSVGPCEDYTLKGTVILEPGWTKYDDSVKTSSRILPNLNKGDTVNINFQPKEKETSPPKHYTIETLNNYLKNPFREEKAAANEMEDADDAEEYRAMFEGLELGTEATRTGIIDNAVKSGYMELKKDVYRILPGGEYLIQQTGALGISMDKYKTSQLGQALKKVFHGQMTVMDSVKLAEEEIAAVFFAPSNAPDSPDYTGAYGDEVGKCPLCGGTVFKGRYGFLCAGYKEGCSLKIPGVLCGRPITVKNAADLLTAGRTEKLSGFVSKKGKPFQAALQMKNGKTEFLFEDS